MSYIYILNGYVRYYYYKSYLQQFTLIQANRKMQHIGLTLVGTACSDNLQVTILSLKIHVLLGDFI